MAEKRAAFSLRRRLSLGFSKCRLLRTTRKVPSRSSLFFIRRRALSTDSPFLSLISVKLSHFLSADRAKLSNGLQSRGASQVRIDSLFCTKEKSTGKFHRPAISYSAIPLIIPPPPDLF